MFLKPVFVLLSGKRKSGKDYLADNIAKHLKDRGWTSTKISISSLLYDEVLANHPGLDRATLDDNIEREKYRQEMIDIGNMHREKDGEDFLIKDVERRGVESGADVVFVPNIRSPNEFSYFPRMGRYPSRTIRINVPDHIRMSRGWTFTPGVDDGNLETGLDHIPPGDWDFWVAHDGYSWNWYEGRIDLADKGDDGYPFRVYDGLTNEIGRIALKAKRSEMHGGMEASNAPR